MNDTGIGVHGGTCRPAARTAIACIFVGALFLLGPSLCGIEVAQSAGRPAATQSAR